MVAAKKISKKEFNEILLHDARILVIEDDRMQRFMIVEILKNAGFLHVEEAVNGKEGFDKTLSFSPHLVILDMNMPVMDGFEYCKNVRSKPEHKDIAILAQTGMTEIKEKAKIFAVGVSDYVSKPIDSEEIVARTFIHLKNAFYIKTLNDYNERVKNELQSAKNLLEVSLPSPSVIDHFSKEHNVDLSAYFKSSNELGGDFWGVHRVSDTKFAIYIIDVSGHGLDSALNALRIHSLILASSDEGLSSADMLQWLNIKMKSLFPIGQYATMFFGIVDEKENILEYSAAACPSPLVFKAKDKKIIEISGKGYPVGAIKDAEYDNYQIEFAKGDSIILYSDAIIESLDGDGEMYGFDRFLKSVKKVYKKNSKVSSVDVLNSVLKDFQEKCGEMLDDDLTVNIYKRI